MNPTLQPVLNIIDEGLRLYRRHFLRFTLLTASWIVPTALGVGLTVAAGAYLNSGVVLLLLALWLVLALPLGALLIGALSRAALAASEGRPVELRAALSIPPLRLVSMSFYTIIFYFLSNMVSSTLLLCVFCPLYMVGAGLVGALAGGLSGGGAVGTALATVLGALLALLFALFYGLSLVVSGATYAALAYALQPFALEALPFGDALQRSFDMIGYRFGRNLLAFVLGSAVFGATAIAVTVAVGVLLPLPLLLALGAESPLAQGVSVAAWALGLVVVVPPLPIWMALWYRRNAALRDGADLGVRIEQMIQEIP
jgi:hypothetical protein